MVQSADARVPYASLQIAHDGPSLRDRHVAAGRLISPNVVVIPALPRDVADMDVSFEVVVASGEGDDQRAEVIRASHIEAHGLDDGDLAAIVYLERPSTFTAPPVGDRLSSEELTAELRRYRGQLGPVFEAIGYGPPADDDRLRDQLDDVTLVRLDHDRGIDVMLHPSIDELGIVICSLIPWWCEPPDSGGGP